MKTRENVQQSPEGRRTTVKRRRQVYLKKLALLFTAVVLAAGLGIGFGSRMVDAHGNLEESPVEHKYYKSIQIESGDTLWEIAETYMNDDYDSIYEYIDEVKEINGLDSDCIQDSKYLTIAYYDTEFK